MSARADIRPSDVLLWLCARRDLGKFPSVRVKRKYTRRYTGYVYSAKVFAYFAYFFPPRLCDETTRFSQTIRARIRFFTTAISRNDRNEDEEASSREEGAVGIYCFDSQIVESLLLLTLSKVCFFLTRDILVIRFLRSCWRSLSCEISSLNTGTFFSFAKQFPINPRIITAERTVSVLVREELST